jgi:uncharacterized membrane protein YdcZ (DUF606 family)
MPAWKVLLIGAFACVVLALATATVLVPMAQDGGRRWVWLGGLLAATLVAGGLFALFMRQVGRSMDTKPSWARR